MATTAVRYYHPVRDDHGKRLSAANIIWAERDRGSPYYRVSRYAMKKGSFPPDHPCAPFDEPGPANSSQIGGSKALNAFRSLGYWASCFPEGDGITIRWWDDTQHGPERNAEEVMRDIRDCFGWDVILGNAR